MKSPSLAQGRARHLYGSIVSRDARADPDCNNPLAVVCMQSDTLIRGSFGGRVITAPAVEEDIILCLRCSYPSKVCLLISSTGPFKIQSFLVIPHVVSSSEYFEEKRLPVRVLSDV